MKVQAGGVTLVVVLVLVALLVTVAFRRMSTSRERESQHEGTASIRLRNVAGERGVRFTWPAQGPSPLDISQTIGEGCAFLDFDGDGWEDLFLVGEPTCGLFLNDGGGHFRDVSEQAGLGRVRGAWRGVAVGDWDGDGRPDLFLTGYRRSVLLQNQGGRSLRDVTRVAGVEDHGWASSAGWADLDGDGDLDLVVGHYVRFGPHSRRTCMLGKGVLSGCPPSSYPAEFPRVFRNDHGRMVDVTGSSGLSSSQGKNLALAFCDYDGDGKPDLYFANDGTPGDLFTNLGEFHFRNDNFLSGTAFGSDQAAFMSGMGADWGDYDNDGHPDLIVTNFSNFDYSLFRNKAPVFEHVSRRLGISEPTWKPLGFGTRFVDFDNDQYLDLVFANGHVYDNIHEIDPSLDYREPLLVLRNENATRFENVTAALDPSARNPIVGRGLASGDFDNDGRVDLLVVDHEGSPLLLHNESRTAHWLGIEVVEPKQGRNGVGTRMTLEGPGFRLVRDVAVTASYLSSSDPRVVFGLGPHCQVTSLTVHWQGRPPRRYSVPQVDRYFQVRPDEADLRPSLARKPM